MRAPQACERVWRRTGGLLRRSSGASRPGVRRETSEERERRLWPRSSHVYPLSFRRGPLLFALLGFAGGSALTRIPFQTPRTPALLAGGTAALFALTLLAARRAFRVVLPALFALWMGVGLWSTQLEPAPAPQKQLAAYEHDGFFAAMDTFKDKQTLDTLNETGEAPWEVWRTNERRMQKAAKAFASNSGTVAAPATAATPRPI